MDWLRDQWSGRTMGGPLSCGEMQRCTHKSHGKGARHVLNANVALSLFPFIDQRKILQQGAIITQLLDLGRPRRHQTRKTQPMVWAHFSGKTIPLLKILIYIRRCAPCWQLYNCTVSVTGFRVLHKIWFPEVYEKVRIGRIATVISSFNDRENLENGILCRLKRPEYNDRCYFSSFWSSNHVDNFSGLNSQLVTDLMSCYCSWLEITLCWLYLQVGISFPNK